MNGFRARKLRSGRRWLAWAVVGSVALAATTTFPLAAQPSQRIFKVGLVWSSPPQADLDRGVSASLKLIEEGLRDLDWTQGRNIELVSKSAESRYERFPAIVDELARLQVDVLVVFGPEAGKVARERAPAIPLVNVVAYNRPPGRAEDANATGTVVANPVGKRLELLKAIAPGSRRTAMFARVAPGERRPELTPSLIAAARRIGLDPFAVYFETPDQLESMFEAVRRRGADSIYMSTFPQLAWDGSVRRLIVALAARHRLPAVYEDADIAGEGGLIAFSHDVREPLRRAVYFIDRILRGAKPAELPMEQPVRFYLNINRRTAAELGLEIPLSLRIQADRVIE